MAKETASENEGWCSMTRSYPLTDAHRLCAYRRTALPTKGHGGVWIKTVIGIRRTKIIHKFIIFTHFGSKKAGCGELETMAGYVEVSDEDRRWASNTHNEVIS